MEENIGGVNIATDTNINQLENSQANLKFPSLKQLTVGPINKPRLSSVKINELKNLSADDWLIKELSNELQIGDDETNHLGEDDETFEKYHFVW